MDVKSKEGQNAKIDGARPGMKSARVSLKVDRECPTSRGRPGVIKGREGARVWFKTKELVWYSAKIDAKLIHIRAQKRYI